MPAGSAPLNGFGPQEIWINVYRESQNISGNYSTYRVQLVYVANGYGSWSGATQYWSLSGPGYWEGTFVIGSPGTSNITLADFTFTRSHDAQGYGSAFTITGGIDTNHSAIGDGSVSVTEAAPPRIPKAPSQNGAPVASNLMPTQVTLTWPANGNNNGASIDQYRLRVGKNNPVDTGTYTDYLVSASTLSKTVTGLTPGTQYYAVVYARNSQGYSIKSAQTAFKTPSGFYRWTGSTWAPTEVLAWNGTTWKPCEVHTYKSSGVWELAQ